MNSIKKIYNIFDKRQKKQFKILAFLSIVTMILETFSVSLVIPLLNSFLNNDTIFLTNILNFFFSSDFLSKSNILIILISFFLLVFLIKAIFIIYYTLYKNKFVYSVRSGVSSRIFSNVLKVDYSFHVKTNSSIVINVLTKEVEEMVSLVDSGITFFTESLVVVGLFFLIIFYEPINIVAIIFLSFFAISIYQLTKKKVSKWGIARQEHEQSRILHINQSIDGIKEIKIAKLESVFFSKFEYHNNKSAKIGRYMTTLSQIPRVLLEFFGLATIFLTVLFFSYSGKSSSDIIAILGILVVASFRILPSMNRTLGTVQQLRYAKPVVDLIYYFIHSEIFQKKIQAQDIAKVNFFNKLEMKNISFSYFDENKSPIKILENINFVINKGDFVGIVGKTGSGKTTLMNILLGLLDPITGEIFVDNKNISKNISSWQSIIGYVPQGIFLIDDTIKNNIILNDENFNSDNYNQALIDSELDSFVNNLSLKSETNIGERGVKISGGQKQRIGLARVLYKNPSVIILDEATSALDIATEKKIIDTIQSLVPSKTIIAVSHRLDTLTSCNKIFNLENKKLKIAE